MSGDISIRVLAKTEADEVRHVTVAADGSSVSCDCAGFRGGFCSHIDAVLVAEERAMVLPEDIGLADRATALMRGRIAVPESWRGHWRGNLRWRGISHEGRMRRLPERVGHKPIVVFTGEMPAGSRDAMKAEAIRNGWDVTGKVSGYTDVLVAADPSGSSAKLTAARANGTPIITPDEWADLMLDGALPR